MRDERKTECRKGTVRKENTVCEESEERREGGNKKSGEEKG